LGDCLELSLLFTHRFDPSQQHRADNGDDEHHADDDEQQAEGGIHDSDKFIGVALERPTFGAQIGGIWGCEEAGKLKAMWKEPSRLRLVYGRSTPGGGSSG
jgi:hypothetical protein